MAPDDVELDIAFKPLPGSAATNEEEEELELAEYARRVEDADDDEDDEGDDDDYVAARSLSPQSGPDGGPDGAPDSDDGPEAKRARMLEQAAADFINASSGSEGSDSGDSVSESASDEASAEESGLDGVDGVLCVHALPFSVLLLCSRGSVVRFSGDCIVNAANQRCLGGGGVDGAISDAGGAALDLARRALSELRSGVRCEVGGAVRTVGGDLLARWCVHAVGPNYNNVDVEDENAALLRGDALLRSAYAEAMLRAQEVGAKTIGFSLLSSGIFRGKQSLQNVLRIAVEACRDGAYEGLDRVHLIAFTPREQAALVQAADELLGRRADQEGRPQDGVDDEPRDGADDEPRDDASPADHEDSPDYLGLTPNEDEADPG
eukprot:CAMPEP_0184120794 /NCGR_PEP_ID=MMETSP0974-20121125/22644_1 /TAXON_ID=483370 /ORGANISM="non described non described, Strain CCMP2097" /LENGTH=377 /DNA_ID=CAMNT_0026423989 /DNA_START=79 /DNA_END=1209 /DNA_ORIENTATION=-